MFKAAKKHRLFCFGAFLSVAYITALIGFTGLYKPERLTVLQAMPLNELGDFLAGAFGPMAIFWVVLGFIQQGAELRNSVATLEMQARELANSAEQHRELARVSRAQLEHEQEVVRTQRSEQQRRLQPKFTANFENTPDMTIGYSSYDFTITNGGGDAHQVGYDLVNNGVTVVSDASAFAHRGWVSRAHRLSLPFGRKNKLMLELRFVDDEGENHRINLPVAAPF